MITSPTVLILGAGSNVEYGFPTGDQLRMAIINGLNDLRIQDYFDEHFDYAAFDLMAFASDFKESSESIDRFLEQNPSYRKIGYHAIAYYLTRHEHHAQLYRTDTPRWYDYLWRKLDEGHDKSFGNMLSIITFNYDRSLEHYLAMAIRRNYHANDVSIGESLKRLRFIHLYGTIGGQPLIDDPHPIRGIPVPFGDISRLQDSAATIEIIERSTDDKVSEAFAAAHKAISKAEYIFILGFGFDWLNCERLAVADHMRGDARVYATAYEMGGSSQYDVRVLLQLTDQRLQFVDGRCLDLFDRLCSLPTR